jgi:hypothetical protein
MKEALGSSETSALTRATGNIPEDIILHSHSREKPQTLHVTGKAQESCFLLKP